MLLSLVGCGNNSNSTEAKNGFYKVCGVSYPAELGAPVLGEAAAELADSAIFSDAAKQITNVGDAYYYLSARSRFDQPFDTCKLFITLLATDYDELGMIYLERIDNGYCVAYVKSGDTYYPFDPFSMSEAWILDPKYNCISDTDFKALCERLMTTLPYNPNGAPMTSWDAEVFFSNTVYTGVEKEIVTRITTPQYTEAQIEQWVAEGLTLDEWAEKITTPADAIQMLRAIDYNENEIDDNLDFFDEINGSQWVSIWNAHYVFYHRAGNCGGTSVIFNYLLTGDFDEQGYVQFNSAAGGHMFNYFVIDGVYVVCDFIGIPDVNFFINETDSYAIDASAAILYIGNDVEAFGKWYRNEGPFANNFEDTNSEDYLYHFFMYPCEGTRVPVGCDDHSPSMKFGNPKLSDLFPVQYKDIVTILYEREGYPLRFVPTLDRSAWPEALR